MSVKPIVRWCSLPLATCREPGCDRVEYRDGLCRSCWPAYRAWLVHLMRRAR